MSQVYGSTLPVAYSSHSSELWSAFAQSVLEASYEAALFAGVLKAVRTGNIRVYFTLLGGGAFGNAEGWIMAAIERSMRMFADTDLDVAIVSYGSSKPLVQQLVVNLRGCV